MMTQTKQQIITLANRPKGMPSKGDFNFVESEVPKPKDNEILVRTLYLSVDPYMRGRMQETKSYIAPFELNKVITGGVVAEVIESKSSSFKKGMSLLGISTGQNTQLSPKRKSASLIPRWLRSQLI